MGKFLNPFLDANNENGEVIFFQGMFYSWE